MVVLYDLDRVVKICVFMASVVIFLVVPITLLRKAFSFVKFSEISSSGDGHKAVNFDITRVWPSFIEALSRRSLSAFNILIGWSSSSISGRTTSQNQRFICAFALLAWSCQLSFRGRRLTLLPVGKILTLVRML